MRLTAIVAGAVLVSSLVAACGATKYSDDLITAITRITGKTADEAIGLLDDAARAGQPIADELALISWSSRVGRYADNLSATWFDVPDDAARARSFVVGTTCDAFEELGDLPFVTAADVRGIVDENWLTSGLPDILATPLFLAQVAEEIYAALLDGNLASAYPVVARLAICEAVG